MTTQAPRFVFPYETAIDPTGVPLPGAQLWFYFSGTSTPLSTYNDSALTVPNTNPVVANSAGRFPSIFLLQISYKVVLLDEDGDQVWTADPVYGSPVSGTYAFPTTTALLAAFPAFQALPDGTIADTAGRDTRGDKGGATFYYNAVDTTTPDNGGTIRVDGAGRRWYLAYNGPVSVAWFGAKGDGANDDAPPIQATHNYVEGLLGGRVHLINGAKHKLLSGLTWDLRLVGLDGLGATLDYTSIVPGNVGLNLVTGDNSTFASSTGSWTFVNATTSLVAGGVQLTNTAASNGYGYLPITTVPGTWYCVTYIQQAGPSLAQMNLYAHIEQNSLSLNYDTDASNAFFLFQATSTITYLTMRVSTTNIADTATIGSITCQVSVPPAFNAVDRSNQFANAVTPGNGYQVGDSLTVSGGTFSAVAKITVFGVDQSGAITAAELTTAGTYTSFPTNPVFTTGGSGTGATFNIGNSTPQFGHEAYPIENFLMVGPGRDLAYTVDTQTPYQIYSQSSCAFGIYLNSTNQAGNRNSTSSRGTMRNINIRNFWSGFTYNNQAYLMFTWDMGISNCNFGWLSVSGQNAGENNTNYGGWVTGCDVNICCDAHGIKFDHTSIDFPKQAQLRINAPNVQVVLNECHIEQSPPGQSTQIVDPIALTSTATAATLTIFGGELMVTGGYVAGSYPQIISTQVSSQYVIFSSVQMNNLVTSYLVSGPGVIKVDAPSRFLQFPAIPQLLNDQGAGASQMDCFGFGDFERPAVATSTIPRGMIAIGSSLDDLNFNQTYSGTTIGQLISDKMNVRNGTSVVHSGAQALRVSKLNDSPTAGMLYFVAPVRPGFQHWWSLWINVPAPTVPGAPAKFAITATQNYVQLLGTQSVYLTTPNGQSQQVQAFPFRFSGNVPGLGQVFTGNVTQGAITTNNTTGTNGWQFFITDTFNHGTAKAPANASHIYLQLDFSQFDGSSWGATSAWIDDVFCWQL